MLISQGELGVMHPGNAGTVKFMATYGASPCVILCVRKGTTTILGHIHKANSLARLEIQLGEILADALPSTAVPKAILSTEPYTGMRIGEAGVQARIVQSLREMLARLGVVHLMLTNDSAVTVTGDDTVFSTDGALVRSLPEVLNKLFVEWAMAYDNKFGTLIDSVPMAIRVGANTESPQQAMLRLFR